MRNAKYTHPDQLSIYTDLLAAVCQQAAVDLLEQYHPLPDEYRPDEFLEQTAMLPHAEMLYCSYYHRLMQEEAASMPVPARPTPVRDQVLGLLRLRGAMSPHEIARVLEHHNSARVRSCLHRLKERGEVRQLAHGRYMLPA